MRRVWIEKMRAEVPLPWRQRIEGRGLGGCIFAVARWARGGKVGSGLIGRWRGWGLRGCCCEVGEGMGGWDIAIAGW